MLSKKAKSKMILDTWKSIDSPKTLKSICDNLPFAMDEQHVLEYCEKMNLALDRSQSSRTDKSKWIDRRIVDLYNSLPVSLRTVHVISSRTGLTAASAYGRCKRLGLVITPGNRIW